MSEGGRLLPRLAFVSSTLEVEISVVLEDSCLLDILLVVGLLLGGSVRTELVVLGGIKSGRNVGLSFLDFSNLKL